MFQYVPNVHGNVCPEICVFPSRVENPVTRGGLRILRINGEGADQPLEYRAGMALMHMQSTLCQTMNDRNTKTASLTIRPNTTYL